MNLNFPILATLSLVLVPALAACSSNSESSADATVVAVSSTDDACDLSATSAPAGPVTFDVTNNGTQTTEFYLYQSDGTTIVGEVENIGPGLTRSLNVEITAGTYLSACKPGQVGDGITADFTAS